MLHCLNSVRSLIDKKKKKRIDPSIDVLSFTNFVYRLGKHSAMHMYAATTKLATKLAIISMAAMMHSCVTRPLVAIDIQSLSQREIVH